MVLSPENEAQNDNPHPYWYARVLGIYHANVRHIGPNSNSYEPKQMEFLFVCWFGRDSVPPPGWKTKQLIRLGFALEMRGWHSDFWILAKLLLEVLEPIRCASLISYYHPVLFLSFCLPFSVN
jgi:hypothetical protein